MDRYKHLWVLALMLAAGGGLAYKFVPDFELVRMIILAVVVLTGSEVFYRIDKNIDVRNKL